MSLFEEGPAESPHDLENALPVAATDDDTLAGALEEREGTVSLADGDPSTPRKIRIRYFTPHFPGWSALETQRPSREGTRSASHGRTTLPSWGRAAALFVIWLVVLGAPLSMSGGDNEKAMAMPDEFLGEWRTLSPKYEDSFFEISRRQLRLGTGDEAHSVHDISRLTRSLGRGGLVYTLWYVVDEDMSSPHPLSFYYGHEGQSLRLKNQQDIVWSNVGKPRDMNELVRDIAKSSARYEQQYGHLTAGRRGREAVR